MLNLRDVDLSLLSQDAHALLLYNSGLLKIAEDTVLQEMKLRPSTPLYLVGDSFGGALALSIASRNPELDLILILSNPGT